MHFRISLSHFASGTGGRRLTNISAEPIEQLRRYGAFRKSCGSLPLSAARPRSCIWDRLAVTAASSNMSLPVQSLGKLFVSAV